MRRFLSEKLGPGQPISKKSKNDDSSGTDHDNQTPPEQMPSSSTPAPRGGKRTPIWDYFVDEAKKPLTADQEAKMTADQLKAYHDTWFCICTVLVNPEKTRTCGARIKRTQGNTKGMTGHLQTHKAEYAEFLQKKSKGVVSDAQHSKEVLESYKVLGEAQDAAREILNKPPLARKGPETKTIEDYFLSQQALEPWKPNSARQRRVDLSLMLMIARCGLPFSLMDHPGFTE